ncbi:MAG: hypothetical protein UV26_C0002G0044 [candidate division WWE3 bacterium GW2011_GWF2_42_42]|uniref:Uncharacterized protein n=1 Tax=candidate division WWE3 bacterium GW2011_GWF2_42_42 TaxID=1619142 RepID=A0A0G1DEQ4_UNCKA|nr:MAG: hypothetical protein UV26_C0002G0044 [candidate division WWE3 bacterium GW2011_GWF2_42_42]
MKKAIISMAVLFTVKTKAAAITGNGAPSGAHYNLNIIGVSKDKAALMDSSSGHRIFVPLSGKIKINLLPGTGFAVLDANGTDGNGATFSLPNPDADNDGVTSYTVWARALGKPGGTSTTTPCAYLDGVEYCSTSNVVLVREKGKSSFTNVTSQLLYVYADLTGDGVDERYPLFDPRLQDYFWDYDNNGLKVAQFRFYQN